MNYANSAHMAVQRKSDQTRSEYSDCIADGFSSNLWRSTNQQVTKSLLVRFPNLAEFIYDLLLHSQTLRKTSVTDHGRQEKGNHFWRAFSSVGVQRALKIEMRWPFRNPRNMNVKWSAEL